MSEIPVYPSPGFYETTEVETERGPVTHADVEAILARPTWDERRLQIEADVRLRVARILAKRQKGDRTKVGSTPARR